jgi:cytochrome c-type biogenesis protein CcmH/NrfG
MGTKVRAGPEVARGTGKRIALVSIVTVAALILAAAPLVLGQSKVEQEVVEKARSLESRGLLDLAAQTWQQVLLSQPGNTEALAGLARVARRQGKNAEAAHYIEHLRKLNPRDPQIAAIESMVSNQVLNARQGQAEALAAAHNYDGAMQLYRQLYGEHPPDTAALEYYETEAATESGKSHAIAGLRATAKLHAGEQRYQATLGRILTYNPKTRAEGEAILQQLPEDAAAQSALRQALLWDAQNPASSGAIKHYLNAHPDAELAQHLQATETWQLHQPRRPAANPAEQAAYAALQAKDVDRAEALFRALLAREPANPRALAGLGFVRMEQGGFAQAAGEFEAAQKSGSKDKAVAGALDTAHFWLTMGEAGKALEQNQVDLAAQRYREALARRPASPEALAGLAGTLLRARQSIEAAQVYARWVTLQPNSAPAWRGLFAAQAQAGQPQQALATSRRFPNAVEAALAADPEYLLGLADAYRAAGGHDEQAAGLYGQVAAEQPSNFAAWEGLIQGQHNMHDDAGALASVERMPPDALAAGRRDAGFLSLIAAAYQQQGRGEAAQHLLEEAQHLLEAAQAVLAQQGTRPSADMELQMAGIERQRNRLQAAAALYRKALDTDPQRVDAWNGLLSTLHQSGDDAQALAEVAAIPAPVQGELSGNDDYLLILSAIYSATGHSGWALASLARLRARYAAQHTPIPAGVEIQSSWLFFSTGDESDLYPTLMRLGGRNDLTDGQRSQIQAIWAAWSVRRAGQAVAAGNSRRALEILNAAREALGGNAAVSRSLAGGYLAAGDATSALAIYRSLDLTSSADYQGALRAALAANNLKLAESWLRQALELYPRDGGILGLAARFEQARGDNGRARAYWKASLAVSPDTGAADRLAHTLRAPVAGLRERGPLLPGDTLASLLGEESSQLRRTNRLPGESEPPPDEVEGPAVYADAPTTPYPQTNPPVPVYPALAGGQPTSAPLTIRYASATQATDSPRQEPQAPGLTDQQLVESQLPPLRGNYVPELPSLNANQEARQQIEAIDGGFSPWVGGTGQVHHRSGTLGYDQLTTLEAPFEASSLLGTGARLTVITTPVFLDAGVADGTSTEMLGTLPVGKIPPLQYADGVGSELQLTSNNFAARVGQTPYGLLVTNIIGGVRWRPAGGPLTFTFARDGSKETQLAYSGLRDPGSATTTFDGNIWGGVVINAGDVEVAGGGALSGFYAGAGGQYITGQHVLTNTRFHGNAGAYWRILSRPGQGTLVLGADFFGMHYAHNLRYFTYGQGGYFSPEAYFLAAMPLTWSGQYGPDLHYNVRGSIGAQSFQEDSAPYFPLDPNLQAQFGNPQYPVNSKVGANYDLRAEVGYRVQDHWWVGGFLDFNNTRDYLSQSGGFFVRYLFRPQPDLEGGPIGIFPRDGFRPVMVP